MSVVKTRKQQATASHREFSSLLDVQRKFPERSEEAAGLWNCVRSGYPTVVTGPVSSGKSALVSAVLDGLGRREVICDCVRAGSEGDLFSSLLVNVGQRPASNASNPSVQEFIDSMSKLEESTVIVVDRAERLRNNKFSRRTIALLLKLNELVEPAEVSCVLITEVRWSRFLEEDPTLPMTFGVRFPAYTRDQIQCILVRTGEEEPEYKEVCKLVLDVVFGGCRDLRELRCVCENTYPKYTQFLDKQNSGEKNASALYRHMHGYLKEALRSLYSRYRSDTTTEEDGPTSQSATLGLSFYAKALLITCYLAGKNPPRTDRRYFTPNWRERKSRRRLASSADEEPNSLRAIPLQRVLAILPVVMSHSEIRSDQKDWTTEDLDSSIFVHIATLAGSGLISRVGDSLSEPKFRCTMEEGLANILSKDLKFSLRNFLHSSDK